MLLPNVNGLRCRFYEESSIRTQLFNIVWTKDKKVLAVTPGPEFKPLFYLQYEDLSQRILFASIPP